MDRPDNETMNEDSFLKRIWNKIFPQRVQPQPPQKDAENRARLHSLIQMVDRTEENELSCDEVFALLDQYVELVVEDRQAANLLPLVQEHLDRCRDCHEEFEALIRVIEGAEKTN